jgi:hypothetical protein
MNKECNDCKENNITLNKMENYVFEELEAAIPILNKSSYTNDEAAYLYNLYNRVFNQNKQPGCGKCFVNIRKKLQARYDATRPL